MSTNVRNFNAAFLSDATSTQPEAFWSRVDYEIGRLSDWNDVMAQDISTFWRDLRDFFLRSEHKSFWTELGVAPPGRKPDGDLFGASYVKLRETPTQTSKETIQSNYYDYHILWGTTWQSVQVQGYTGYKTEPSQFPTGAALKVNISPDSTKMTADEIKALDSDDWFGGFGRSLSAYFGPGDDYAAGSWATQTFYGGDGDDWLKGFQDADILYGDWANAAIIRGSASAGFRFTRPAEDPNVIGNDKLEGGDGDDRLYGGPGEDHLRGESGSDELFGGPDNDRLEGNSGNDDLHGGGADDILRGDDGSDLLEGNAGGDTLQGDKGGDTLRGGDGDDQLNGGPRGEGWTDVLTGGAGADVFYLNYASVDDPSAPAASWWADYGVEVGQGAAKSIVRDIVSSMIKSALQDSLALMPGGVIMSGLLSAASTSVNFGFGRLFEDAVPPATSSNSDDVMIVTDFDPREDVLFLPMTQGRWQKASVDIITAPNGQSGWGASFSDTGGKTYAYVLLAADYLAEFNLQQGDAATRAFLENLFATSLEVTGNGISGDHYPFPTDPSDYVDGQVPPGLSNEFDPSTPSNVEARAFGALGPLMFYGPSLGTTKAIVGGTHMGDLLNVNPDGFAPENFRSQQLTSLASTVKAFGGDDIVMGGNGQDRLHGGAGDDALYPFYTNATSGGLVPEWVYGEAGDDTLFGGETHALLDGGGGIDTIDFSLSRFSVQVDLAAAFARDTGAGALPSNTYDLVSIENVTGTPGDDTLIGDENDNVFVTLDGTDSVDGNGGTDAVDYSATGATIVAELSDGWARLLGTGGVTLKEDSLASIEGVYAGDGNNELYGSDAGDVFHAGNGRNLILAYAGANVIVTGSGNDEITTHGGNDTIDAGDGGNIVKAGNGKNHVTTGSGDDQIATGNGTDTILGGAGANTISSGGSADHITTGNGNDMINSGNGGNTIHAGGGANQVTSGNGNDTITTEAGSDQIDAGDGANNVNAGGGDDTIQTGSGADVIFAGSGADSITTGGGNDTVHAEDGNDWIDAGEGDDVVHAGDGDDYCIDDAGADEYYGDAGIDTIDFSRLPGETNLGYDIFGVKGSTSDGYSGDCAINGNTSSDFYGFEEFLGSSKDDSFVFFGFNAKGDLVLNGLEGNDDLYVASGLGTLIGGKGDDVTTAKHPNAAHVWGIGDGNDTISGGFVEMYMDDGSKGANTISFAWDGPKRVLTATTSPLGEVQTISSISKLVIYSDPDGTSISGQNALTQAGIPLEIIDPAGGLEDELAVLHTSADEFLL